MFHHQLVHDILNPFHKTPGLFLLNLISAQCVPLEYAQGFWWAKQDMSKK